MVNLPVPALTTTDTHMRAGTHTQALTHTQTQVKERYHEGEIERESQTERILLFTSHMAFLALHFRTPYLETHMF